MTSLFFGQLTSTGVPADEKVVRSTATPVEVDAPAAMADDMPQQSEVETDPNPHIGMTNRQVASTWHEGTRGTPAWIPETDSVTASFAQINGQVSSSGTAAAREASGQVNKNSSYAVGIEAVGDLSDPNHKFGEKYFVRNQRGIQATMDASMSLPPGSDPDIRGHVAEYGKVNARKASMAAVYDQFWNGGSK